MNEDFQALPAGSVCCSENSTIDIDADRVAETLNQVLPSSPTGNYISLQEVAAELDASYCDAPFDLSKVRTVNQWIEEARCRPVPAELFGPFWFEGELGILFADTNVGKSLLAVQIADALSRESGIRPFGPRSGPLKVLYADFELSDKQLENRYSTEYQNHYHFNDRFLRAEMNPDYEGEEEDFEALLLASFEELVVACGVEVLIVDNLMYLATENEKARNALPLMKALNKLKRGHRISILVLAHTPKRDPSKPIGTNDVPGSKALINLCDRPSPLELAPRIRRCATSSRSRSAMLRNSSTPSTSSPSRWSRSIASCISTTSATTPSGFT